MSVSNGLQHHHHYHYPAGALEGGYRQKKITMHDFILYNLNKNLSLALITIIIISVGSSGSTVGSLFTWVFGEIDKLCKQKLLIQFHKTDYNMDKVGKAQDAPDCGEEGGKGVAG